jgi:hypothetical protein
MEGKGDIHKRLHDEVEGHNEHAAQKRVKEERPAPAPGASASTRAGAARSPPPGK